MSIIFSPIYLPENQGHGNARRVSLQNCSNSLVAIMDADDLSWSGRFEKQLRKFISDIQLDIVGGQISEFIGSKDNIISSRIVPEKHEDIIRYMKRRCPMNQMSVMMKKAAYERAGGYLDWYCNEDYYLWVRMVLNGCKFANVSDHLVNVRIGDEMSARRGGWKYFKSEERLQRYMLNHRIISYFRYLYNVTLRFGGQVIASTSLRTKLFKFFRTEPTTPDITNENERMDIRELPSSKGIGQFPPFSVAMCVYAKDNPEWFAEALDSIINQTVKPSEIVLVVDGPIPPDLQSVIDRYSELCGGA